MFYKIIENKRNQWLSSPDCTITSLIDYIVRTGQMRDAQIEAIKTYLFLKIACQGKPLSTLFKEGAFNTLDLNALELSQSTRDYLISLFTEFDPQEGQMMERAFREKWIDFYPRAGKAGGATCYSIPAIGESRISLNFGENFAGIKIEADSVNGLDFAGINGK